MQLSEAIKKYENNLNEAREGLEKRKKLGCKGFPDMMIIKTLELNVQEYADLVGWLKELQERRNAEVGLFYEEKAKRQAEQS